MTLPDGRSPMAWATEWATRIMTISLEMVLPGLAGYWLDQQLGTLAVFMLVGFALGCTAAVVHLIHLTRVTQAGKQNNNAVDESSKKG